MSDINWANSEAICCVLANERSRRAIEKVFQNFLEDREVLETDYCEVPNDSSKQFASEDEMIEFFVNNQNTSQTFFWSDKDKIVNTVGACFSSDGFLVITVTTSADGVRELDVFERLKSVLESETGFISYNLFPVFEDGDDFRNKAENLNEEMNF